MEPEEFLNGPTVYKEDQVITQQDLRDAIFTLFHEYEHIDPIFTMERHGVEIAIRTLETMLEWVVAGKPTNFNMERPNEDV